MAGNRPTHFTGGVSVSTVSTPLYLMPFLDPTQYYVWFSDFDNFRAVDWISQTGTTTATRSIADADGGIVQFVTPAAEDILLSSQWAGGDGSVAETFLFDSTKKLFVHARVKVSDADQTDLLVGLAITDTTPFDATDMIGFKMTDGSAIIEANIRGSGTSSTQQLGTMVDDTFAIVSIAYIPGTGFECYFNNALVGTVAITNAPATELAVTIAMQSGAAAITTASYDYLMIAKER